ncbi:MAG: MnmC family methyltransferase [Myxococcota bacterium]|nr:MnmC family methyltransferase [Myxococcota bacterium]
MLESETVDSVTLADGTEFVLARRDDEWVVRAGGMLLMSSRMHHSEEELAALALTRVTQPRSVLVGGLGLGYTLRAVLDRTGEQTRVTIAELVPAVVEWNRTHVRALAGNPLVDPRANVVVGDVFETIARAQGAFDVILLDVDNGPVGLSQARNQRLYGYRGVRSCLAALRPGGVLAVWSAGSNARFERRLVEAGFEVEVIRPLARKGSRMRHVVFLAKRRQSGLTGASSR